MEEKTILDFIIFHVETYVHTNIGIYQHEKGQLFPQNKKSMGIGSPYELVPWWETTYIEAQIYITGTVGSVMDHEYGKAC